MCTPARRHASVACPLPSNINVIGEFLGQSLHKDLNNGYFLHPRLFVPTWFSHLNTLRTKEKNKKNETSYHPYEIKSPKSALSFSPSKPNFGVHEFNRACPKPHLSLPHLLDKIYLILFLLNQIPTHTDIFFTSLHLIQIPNLNPLKRGNIEESE